VNVQMNDVSYIAGGMTLVDTVTLSAATGEMIAVIGPNGAGKSTLLHLLAGDIVPATGTITYDGEAVHSISLDRRARVRAMLESSHASDISFTVEQVVGMGRFPYRLDPENGRAIDNAAVDEAIGQLDLEELRHRPVRSLSGGEQQRVAIARILAQDAKLVLLDEPTTALDIGHQAAIMALIEGLRPNGNTIVVVLHDLNMAVHFDKTILLREGSVAAAGPPDEVLTSAILSDVYNHPIDVEHHPDNGGTLILPRRIAP
jgi:iron complex transport system ATP-binding protein